jgi:hypothetical protein
MRDGGIGRRGGEGSAEALGMNGRSRGARNHRLGTRTGAYRGASHGQAGKGSAGPDAGPTATKAMQSLVSVHTRMVSYLAAGIPGAP